MITCRPGRVALITGGLLTLAACGGERQDWRSAEAAGTTEAYARFIEQHPGSELAGKAREHIDEFAEERDWERATGSGTLEAYRGFLAAHPHGRWSQEARIRMESYALGSMPRIGPPRSGQASSRAAGVRLLELASTAPVPPADAPPADTAPRAASSSAAARIRTASAGYAVQLGAFGTQAGADRAWQHLQTRFGAQLGGLRPRIVSAGGSSGPLYRLQAPAAGEAQARAICDSLRRRSQACVPVLPR
ncbi:MAG TPA: SPOR domain-containing protein [Steroidobacteraceae bacterium]|nr:SPOR domain-containing protein [Steroidobacteraceae bacterium]